MAEIVASAVITVLIEKLISVDLMKLARSEGIDSHLKKWKNTLPMIQAVLADAEQKHITQRAVELWLNELKHLAYDIDDVLDDMATETMRRKFNGESHRRIGTSKVLKIIPSCFANFSHHNMMYGRNMTSKLDEISSMLNDLLEQKNNLGLDVNVKADIRPNRTYERFQQTSLVDESTVLGREEDTEELLEKLLGDEAFNQKVSVMSIVGLGGIGKTTLAKLLYNDEKVKNHFELRAWVCVSEQFDVFNISKAIYQAVTGEDKAFANLDLLHVAIKEKLSKKRFLVVLDDVWNEDHNQWELLKSSLVSGSPGSKIVVTTRKNKVALVMESDQPYMLEVLSDEIAMSLFAYNTLNEENFDKYPSLKILAQGLIKKCHGLPLALVALGRVLKIKGTSDDVWEELLNSEIWDLMDGSGILPALKLSYYDLPIPLKQLFAYCSLFPKDYKFNKDELVLLWMAEGFLSQSKGSNSMERLGHQYFEELCSRSFFQRSRYDKSEYTMHDLMNDLAVSVAGEFFFMLDDKMDLNGRNEAFERFRHFSFIGQRHAEYIKFKELHRSKRLRTFLPASIGWKDFITLDNVIVELLPKLQFLRVLSLTHQSVTHVPQSVGGLKHLRYLSFSRTSIKQVPEEVSELYNLQSLVVCNCHELYRLPASVSKLINLRHLNMSNTPLLRKTPLGIGGLTSLQTLSKVIIEEANGFKVSNLKHLLNLQGKLSIKGLEKVKDPQQAYDAMLHEKKGLVNLDMEWSDVFDDSRDSMIEYEVIQMLRPHTKLNKLKILRYGGMEFPSWFVAPAFEKLIELKLEGCRNCTHFRSISFPSLEYLEIIDMENLEIWSTCDRDNVKTTRSFPHLREIHIENCPKLVEVSIGLIPSLEVLDIERCSEAVFRDIIGVSSAIQRLDICGIKNLKKLDGEVIKHLRDLEILSIEYCKGLRYLWDSESEASIFLVSLKELDVSRCKKLVSIEEKDVAVGSSNMKYVIREVTIWGCDSLRSYNCPNSVGKLKIGGCDSMTSLTFSTTLQELPSSLKFLEVSSCKNLMSFPHAHLKSLKSLNEMKINNCPSMDDSFPCGLWPPNLRILSIGCLKKPMLEWGMQNYPTSLVELQLYGDNSGVTAFAIEGDAMNTASNSFLLPPSLTSLRINGFKEVESITDVVLQHLTHLQHLYIHLCFKLKDVPQSTSALEVYVYE
ncbi:putative disease resistance RPP13-like protein 1 [Rutidosis leptorrhynchoides]|uniref:putative disease resistance RPP13-like protein 1 n=1 Tax=Rutidosis leptorrhynchoides TaxID=125765 RepID=UPI003A998C39